MNKLWYLQTMEGYSTLRRNEISSPEKSWWKPKCILLSEISQSKQATRCITPMIWPSGKGKTMESIKR